MSKIGRDWQRLGDFPGMMDAADAGPAAGVPDGAAVEQVNLQSVVPGELTVRPGFRYVAFELVE